VKKNLRDKSDRDKFVSVSEILPIPDIIFAVTIMHLIINSMNFHCFVIVIAVDEVGAAHEKTRRSEFSVDDSPIEAVADLLGQTLLNYTDLTHICIRDLLFFFFLPALKHVRRTFH